MKLNRVLLPLLALTVAVMLSLTAMQAFAAPSGDPQPSGTATIVPSADEQEAPPELTAEALAAPPAPTLRPAIDFLNVDFTAAPHTADLEKLLGAWGFRYYEANGLWTATDAYELSLFQRWAGIAPTGQPDGPTRQAMLAAWQQYGETAIPRQKLPLEGRYVGVNPGHQKKQNKGLEALSPDRGSPKKAKVSSGTAGVYTRLPEYAVNLSVGLKLRDRLLALGARVHMSRTVNEVDISNGDRARAMNAEGVQLSLSLHCDGNNKKTMYGLHTLMPGNYGYQRGDVLKKSQLFARMVQEEAIGATGAKNRGLNTRKDLSSLNWCQMPTCLVEMGYMTNAAEDKKLKTEAYQDKLALGLANAVVRYFNEVK